MNEKDEALRLAIDTLLKVLANSKPYTTNWIGIQATILICQSAIKKDEERKKRYIEINKKADEVWERATGKKYDSQS